MESVIVVTPGGYEAELEQRLRRAWPAKRGAGETWVVEVGSSRVYLTRAPSARDDFDPEEIASVLAAIPEPTFYTLDFSDIGLCRDVLASIADDPNLLVDNDHGICVPGSEFVAMLRERPDWDWRHE